jgi:hypothetical protein
MVIFTSSTNGLETHDFSQGKVHETGYSVNAIAYSLE